MGFDQAWALPYISVGTASGYKRELYLLFCAHGVSYGTSLTTNNSALFGCHSPSASVIDLQTISVHFRAPGLVNIYHQNKVGGRNKAGGFLELECDHPKGMLR